jgi:hypothetical protein
MGPNSCPTVTIKGEPSEGNPSGNVVINESDFDETTMVKVEIVEVPIEVPVEVPAQPEDTTTAKVVAPWKAK